MRLRRAGFALTSVLWGVILIAAIGTIALLHGGDAVAGMRNRALAQQTYWRAFACASEARAEAETVLRNEATESARLDVWRQLPLHLSVQGEVTPGCEVTWYARGDRIPAQTSDSTGLARALASFVGPTDAMSIIAALADWQDADDVERTGGADADWYRVQGESGPTNAPIEDPRELASVRGLREVPALQRLFAADSAPIALNSAPEAVLRSLPGFSDGVVAALLLRRNLRPLHSLVELLGSVPPSDQTALMEALPTLDRLATLTPSGWFLEVRASAGEPAVRSSLRLSLALVHSRTTVQQLWSTW